MPIDCRIDHPHKLIVAVASGVVTIDEWAACVAQQVDQGAWAYATLFDCSGADALPDAEAQSKIVRDIEELGRERGQRGPVGILARPALFTRVQTYAKLATELPYRSELFDDPAQAQAWVDHYLREQENGPS